MELRELDRGEVLAAIGGVLIAVSLFLTWYSLGNRYAYVASCRYPHGGCSGWSSLGAIKFLLLIAAVAPGVLVWVVIRSHRLSWPRGELTAVIALCALTLVLFRGIIDRPGWPSGEVGISIGWFVALLGGLLILLGALTRSNESSRRRKPPGML
jgi:hypothetical protein